MAMSYTFVVRGAGPGYADLAGCPKYRPNMFNHILDNAGIPVASGGEGVEQFRRFRVDVPASQHISVVTPSAGACNGERRNVF
jgi:hypothetical protein